MTTKTQTPFDVWVKREIERSKNPSLIVHEVLKLAAHLAHKAGWDLAKFQDKGAAYFLTAEED